MLRQLKIEKADETESSLVDRIALSYKASQSEKNEVHGGSPLVGECLDSRHPTLSGRVLVAWKEQSGKFHQRWLPTLYGVTIRKGDRVLLMSPQNWPEPIVIGVVDGFAIRPQQEKLDKINISLEKDEAISVLTASGERLLEVSYEDSGPVIRLLKEDVDVEIPGRLGIRAKAVDIRATMGKVKIKATDDVEVEGEVIHLN